MSRMYTPGRVSGDRRSASISGEMGVAASGYAESSDDEAILNAQLAERSTKPRRYNVELLDTSFKEIVRTSNTESLIIDTIVICNTTTSVRKFELQHVGRNGSSSDRFCLFHDLTIRPGTSTVIDEAKLYMEPGDTMIVKADAASALACSIYARRI